MKSKIGISVGLLGAGVFLGNLFGGVLTSLLILVYICKFEDNVWLKHMAIKASILTFTFSILVFVASILPNSIGILDSFVEAFGGNLSFNFVTSLSQMVRSAISLLESVLFIALAIKALGQGTYKISFVDKLVDEHFRKFQKSE